ncbi:MAG: CocE/NonD family hydrolase, partial [Nitriliruptor sp.]
MSALIDWAVANAPVASIDDDPIVGMTGGSYAGGIQTATASIDSRLDALAPEISWADLRYSLYSGEVVNQGWVAALYAAGKATATLLGQSPDCPAGPQDGGLDPAIDQGVTEFITSGTVGPDTLDFFAKSSLASYGETDPVTVPTLVMQGSVDTLFDLTDGYRIYEHVRDQGAPARFVAFCGGHVACPDTYADAGDRAHLDDAIVAWFARHLKGEDVATGAPIEYRTNDGEWRSAPSMPLPGATAVPLEGQAEGLVVVPVLDIPDVEGLAGLIAVPEGIPGLPITTSVPTAEGDPRGATFPVAVAEDGPLEILAIPDVTVTVSGTTVPLDQASPTAHIFVKFVHREAGEVLNLQEGGIRVPLTVGGVTVEVPMSGLAYTIPAGDHLDVEV